MFILKPCPFCGTHGKDVILMREETYLYELEPCKVMYIQCINCGGRGGYGGTDQEARKNWNERTDHKSNSKHKKAVHPR